MNMEPVSQIELEEILTSFNNEEVTETQTGRLIWYIISEFSSQGKMDFTNEEIKNRMNELIVGQTLRELSSKGLIDVNMGFMIKDDTYSLTEKGKEYVADLFSSNNLFSNDNLG